jgi:hypothetical protein
LKVSKEEISAEISISEYKGRKGSPLEKNYYIMTERGV